MNEIFRQSLTCHNFCLTGGGILRLRVGGGHMRREPALQVRAALQNREMVGKWAGGQSDNSCLTKMLCLASKCAKPSKCGARTQWSL